MYDYYWRTIVGILRDTITSKFPLVDAIVIMIILVLHCEWLLVYAEGWEKLFSVVQK